MLCYLDQQVLDRERFLLVPLLTPRGVQRAAEGFNCSVVVRPGSRTQLHVLDVVSIKLEVRPELAVGFLQAWYVGEERSGNGCNDMWRAASDGLRL